jgi:DNA-binding transcriptional ArsR family regulator
MSFILKDIKRTKGHTMDSLQYLNIKSKIKDNSKGQKITAALYLVTAHLSDTDPLKNTIRTHAVTLTTTAHEGHVTAAARAIETLLGAAVIAGLLSEKNVSIICLELRHYVMQGGAEGDAVSDLFAPVLNKSFTYAPPRPAMSHSTTPAVKSSITNDNKSKRQDRILSFINEKKSVAIKDIAALFSDTSEKTIQRELSVLVSAGKITKRGEKRWSVYMCV